MLYFIVNKTSRTGKGAGVWKQVHACLKERGITYKAYQTKYRGHAGKLAARIASVADPDICLVIIGGDGTINEAVSGIYKHGPRPNVRIGVIPNGSGNDFGNGLGLPKNPIENLEKILHAAAMREQYRALDLGHVTGNHPKADHIFTISAGIGLDALVCKDALTSPLKKVLNFIHLGSLTYILLTIYELFSMETCEMDIRYHRAGESPDREEHHRNVIFAAAMNMKAEGGGVPMAPGAAPDDGRLAVCCAHDIPKWNTFFKLPLLVTAHHEGIRGFELTDCESVQAHLSKPMVLHADGEYGGEVTEIQVSVMKGIMQFLQ